MSGWPEYDLALGFRIDRQVTADEIDSYGHVNNAVYLAWLDACTWAHATSLGFSREDAVATQQGMAVKSVIMDYLGPAYLGDTISIITWITHNNGKFRGTRRFDVMKGDARILRASIDYVMLDLSCLKIMLMPQRFRDGLRAVPPKE
jgi:acyl-CoA thioester hydrolase